MPLPCFIIPKRKRKLKYLRENMFNKIFVPRYLCFIEFYKYHLHQFHKRNCPTIHVEGRIKRCAETRNHPIRQIILSISLYSETMSSFWIKEREGREVGVGRREKGDGDRGGKEADGDGDGEERNKGNEGNSKAKPTP